MRRFLAVLGLACLPWMAEAQVVPRVELHPFETRTPTDQQFLTGAADTSRVTIAGELRLPVAGTDRLPAVVLLHGSGGISSHLQAWVHELNGMGIATFVVDSFAGREITSTVADQDRLSRLAMVVDAYRALDLLAAHPRIDPARVAVMGFSRGGGAAHWAAMDRFREMHAAQSRARYALHIAFYPTCNRDFRDALATGAPVRIIHGTADDFIPITECRDLIGRLRAAGRDASILEIPEAHHVFDAPAGNLSRAPQAQTTRGCPNIRETPEGNLVNSATGRPFTYASDPCVERGTTFGRDAAGLETARRTVRDMLVAAGFAR
ncbi:dienelactone hydrolase family protein [Sabulicella rubraurantiaca]|uniref:dienelactone hydrolase family protein n=1 Tax=Sabulicella rubraurantiaca TaxID=2811429 RepID=UPI001A97A07E|nr:dienelactone hydrolase family protein [Sabulicella rubraurantiaca]